MATMSVSLCMCDAVVPCRMLWYPTLLKNRSLPVFRGSLEVGLLANLAAWQCDAQLGWVDLTVFRSCRSTLTTNPAAIQCQGFRSISSTSSSGEFTFLSPVLHWLICLDASYIADCGSLRMPHESFETGSQCICQDTVIKSAHSCVSQVFVPGHCIIVTPVFHFRCSTLSRQSLRST